MDVITDPDVEAVWICSPSQFHADQIKACAANGKHVFCEKPIATDLAETVEAINACNEAGVKLMIGLQRRFDPNFLRVRQAIEKQEVGETIIVSKQYLLRPEIELQCLTFRLHSNCIRSKRARVILHLLRMNMSKVAEVSSTIWQSTILI